MAFRPNEPRLFLKNNSSWSRVGCGPLQILQFLFRQSASKTSMAKPCCVNNLHSFLEWDLCKLFPHIKSMCSLNDVTEFFPRSLFFPCSCALDSATRHFIPWNLLLLLLAPSISLLISSSLASLLAITGLKAILVSLKFMKSQNAEKSG